MQELLKHIETLSSNGLLTTIAGGSIIVWIVSNLRSFFWSIVHLVDQLISFTVSNYYEDNRGKEYNLYLKQRVYNKMLSESKVIWERTRNLDLSNHLKGADYANSYYQSSYDEKNDSQNKTSDLLYGFSIRIILGSLCFVRRSVKTESQKIVVNTDIRVYFSRKRKFLNRLNAEIDRLVAINIQDSKNSDHTKIFTDDGVSQKYKRHMDSIFTNNNEHVELLDDIKEFIANRELYEGMNYPYKYSALIHGVPGCGKTSTILAIASELNRSITYINMTSVSSGRLVDMMQGNANETIFVFEDIDAISRGTTSNRDDSSSNDSSVQINRVQNGDELGTVSSISLADLLNITDGLLSSDGAICIFTTNHMEKLDPAFIRAGRMNKIVRFDYMNGETANRMIEQYLGFRLENPNETVKPAELQEEILQVKLGRSTKEDLERMFSSK